MPYKNILAMVSWLMVEQILPSEAQIIHIYFLS